MVREFLCEEEMFETALHNSCFKMIIGFNEILRSESSITALFAKSWWIYVHQKYLSQIICHWLKTEKGKRRYESAAITTWNDWTVEKTCLRKRVIYT